MKISEIKVLLQQDVVSEELLKELAEDERTGVQKLLISYNKRVEQEAKLKEQYVEKTVYEQKCYQNNFQYICGIDEVGRGPLAGPVVAAAVILKRDSYFPGLTDSKKLSKTKREQLALLIKEQALAYSIVELDNYEIEKHNIYNAARIAMEKAVEKLSLKPDFLLVDAMPLTIRHIPHHNIIKGDEKSVSIAAASVLAKVYRDDLMVKYAKKYPYYDFENNMGYGTKKHLDGINEYGICDIHRRDFSPIKQIIEKNK